LPRPAEQNRRLRDARREKILSAALRLFAGQGLAATRISDIAHAAGMSQGLLYHYWPSKEAIFTDLIRHAFATLNAAVRALDQSPLPPGDKLRLATGKLLQGLSDHPDAGFYHLLIAQATASKAIPAAARSIIDKENQLPYRVIGRIIKAGQRDGSLLAGNPAQMAVTFWAVIKGLAIHQAAHGKFKPPKADILMRIFFADPTPSAEISGVREIRKRQRNSVLSSNCD